MLVNLKNYTINSIIIELWNIVKMYAITFLSIVELLGWLSHVFEKNTI